MYLIDTSVWIDFLKQKKTHQVKYFQKILDEGMHFGLTSIIYQEVLQGAATSHDFNMLDKFLSTQKVYKPKHPIESYRLAGKIYFDCRKKGYTIRSTIDCLIAQIAIENNTTLLHNDNDYTYIQKIRPKLKLLT
ncbi:MAG: PIN domain nuclease [Gammaproteobacteria bacterium]|nr:PIN domain nuclease [Gammaproteobacteria bacterium]MCH9743408.1 PIN domain nuclease [Gammaproteobacteria bacterium]